jgi:hypothetical protein
VAQCWHHAAVLRRGGQGGVPLPGLVGYGPTVWDLLPTYPPRITEHGAPGGSDLPPQNYGTRCAGISGITAGIR